MQDLFASILGTLVAYIRYITAVNSLPPGNMSVNFLIIGLGNGLVPLRHQAIT